MIYLNSQLVIWKDSDNNIDHDHFNKLFEKRFNKKFLVYNLTDKKINFSDNQDKILDFKAPQHPSYSLEFLLTFSISVKNWLSLDSYNILIVHDNLRNVKKIYINLINFVLFEFYFKFSFEFCFKIYFNK